MKNVLITLRPAQWYKNGVLLAGLVFSVNFTSISMLGLAAMGFVSFCGISGCGYLINDLLDRERDRAHPIKSRRPIASGQLRMSEAIPILLVLLALSLILAYAINLGFFLIAIGYLLLMALYSAKLKHIIILDTLIISAGFVIRAVAGCLAINVFISPWLIICTFLLALFLALAKRKSELTTLGENSNTHRQSLNGFTAYFLEQLLNITTAALIVAYLLYTFHTNNYYMMLTIPFPIYGLFRYLLLLNKGDFGEEPEKLFKDKALLISLAAWVLSLVLILYFGPAKPL